MMLQISILVAALLLLAVLFIASRPAAFTISRRAVIPAPPTRVFAAVNRLASWPAWSPWARLDPQMQTSLSGPEEGVGAISSWSGNREVGRGMMTIAASEPSRRLEIRLDFEAPMKATNIAEFRFVEVEGGTELTWSMSGTNGFVGKIFGLFFDCDKMVGAQFEQGLANLAAEMQRGG